MQAAFVGFGRAVVLDDEGTVEVAQFVVFCE
jgi:hypothetical protein